jgi:hypothetical protein
LSTAAGWNCAAFGALSVRSRDARAGRNPRTGEPVDVQAKHVPFFKSGKELRERLNATDEYRTRSFAWACFRNSASSSPAAMSSTWPSA